METTHVGLEKTLSLVLLLYACKYQYPSDPIDTPLIGPPVTILSVEPSYGYSGTLVTVALQHNRDSVYVDYLYELNGVELLTEYSSPDTLRIRFPRIFEYFGMNAIVVDMRTDSSYRVKIDFRPVPEICGEQVCTKWFDNDSVTPKLVFRYARGGYWKATRSGDTISVQYDVFDGYSFRSITKFFDNGANTLPQILSYKVDYQGWEKDTSRLSLVKIDQWNTNGVLSGGLFTSDDSMTRRRYSQFYFYVSVQ